MFFRRRKKARWLPREGATTSRKHARTQPFCHTATSHHAKGMQMVHVERAPSGQSGGRIDRARSPFSFFVFCAGEREEERASCSRRSLLGLLHRVIRKSLNNKPHYFDLTPHACTHTHKFAVLYLPGISQQCWSRLFDFLAPPLPSSSSPPSIISMLTTPPSHHLPNHHHTHTHSTGQIYTRSPPGR